MPIISDAHTALGILHTHIEARFTAVSPLADGSAVDIVLQEAEPVGTQRVGCPYVLLSIIDEPDSSYGFYAYRANVRADAFASDFAGGLVGAANPDAAQEVIASALSRLIRDDYDVLRELGLMASKYHKGRSGKTEANSAQPALAYAEGMIEFVFLTHDG